MKKANLFKLMTKNSRRYLYKKYGSFVASSNKRRVISYRLEENRECLSSRITEVAFCDNTGEY